MRAASKSNTTLWIEPVMLQLRDPRIIRICPHRVRKNQARILNRYVSSWSAKDSGVLEHSQEHIYQWCGIDASHFRFKSQRTFEALLREPRWN